MKPRTIGSAAAWVILLLLSACRKAPELSVDTLLWRLDRDWTQSGDVRSATATLISFRSSGEFVELHAWLVERPDSTVYLLSNRPRIAAVGKWTREDDVVTARRDRVSPAARSLCAEPPLSFRVMTTSVIGNAGGKGEGSYSPVTRLVIPELETHLREASHSCAPPPV